MDRPDGIRIWRLVFGVALIASYVGATLLYRSLSSDHINAFSLIAGMAFILAAIFGVLRFFRTL